MSEPENTPKPPQINVVQALGLLLACQLAGETIVAVIRAYAPGVAFPGPVVGMALLLILLVARGNVGQNLNAAAGVILANLSLLFVPAAVGVVRQIDALRSFGPSLLIALLVSTILTLVVTVGVFVAVQHAMGINDEA